MIAGGQFTTIPEHSFRLKTPDGLQWRPRIRFNISAVERPIDYQCIQNHDAEINVFFCDGIMGDECEEFRATEEIYLPSCHDKNVCGILVSTTESSEIFAEFAKERNFFYTSVDLEDDDSI